MKLVEMNTWNMKILFANVRFCIQLALLLLLLLLFLFVFYIYFYV